MMNSLEKLPPLPPMFETQQLTERYGVSNATISRWPDFPAPIRLGRRHYWPVEKILDWERRRFGVEAAS